MLGFILVTIVTRSGGAMNAPGTSLLAMALGLKSAQIWGYSLEVITTVISAPILTWPLAFPKSIQKTVVATIIPCAILLFFDSDSYNPLAVLIPLPGLLFGVPIAHIVRRRISKETFKTGMILGIIQALFMLVITFVAFLLSFAFV